MKKQQSSGDCGSGECCTTAMPQKSELYGSKAHTHTLTLSICQLKSRRTKENYTICMFCCFVEYQFFFFFAFLSRSLLLLLLLKSHSAVISSIHAAYRPSQSTNEIKMEKRWWKKKKVKQLQSSSFLGIHNGVDCSDSISYRYVSISIWIVCGACARTPTSTPNNTFSISITTISSEMAAIH